MRDVLAEQGTAVVSVHPGPITTDMTAGTPLEEVAEPPTLVADALLEALKKGDFHVFPDSMARHVGSAYQGFAESVIDGSLLEIG